MASYRPMNIGAMTLFIGKMGAAMALVFWSTDLTDLLATIREAKALVAVNTEIPERDCYFSLIRRCERSIDSWLAIGSLHGSTGRDTRTCPGPLPWESRAFEWGGVNHDTPSPMSR